MDKRELKIDYFVCDFKSLGKPCLGHKVFHDIFGHRASADISQTNK